MQGYKLDLKDRKLLYELDFDARQSLSSLAKKIGLSKQGVEYKIRKLIADEVILGFYPVVDLNKLGYTYGRVTFSLRNTDSKIEREIIDYLKKSRFFWVFSLQGIYDIGCAMWFQELREFEKELDKLYSKFGEFIDRKNETIATDVIYFQSRFLFEGEEPRIINVSESSEIFSIDELDKRIIKQLSLNARAPIVEIASALNENPKVVSYRIKKMEEKGIIKAYRVNLNLVKLGFTWHKLWIKANSFSNEIFNFLKEEKSILYAVRGISSPAEIDVEVVVKNNEEIYEFVKKLRDNFPREIGSYESFLMYRMEKISYNYF